VSATTRSMTGRMMRTARADGGLPLRSGDQA